MDVEDLFISTFEQLTPDINDIYQTAYPQTKSDWNAAQMLAVAGSGAAATSIPVAHLAAIVADVAFLMNRMAVTSFGIGAIDGYDNGFGNFLEEEDFANVLAQWSGEINYPTLFTGKMAADFSGKLTTKAGIKLVGKHLASSSGFLIGKKLGGKVAAKGATKFAGKFLGKLVGGFIPILGPMVGAGINAYFIETIMEAADDYYAFKMALLRELD